MLFSAQSSAVTADESKESGFQPRAQGEWNLIREMASSTRPSPIISRILMHSSGIP
jgi:hypothetical protein